MKLLLALAGLVVATGLAAPAYADDNPAPDDAGFLSALQTAGIKYANPDQAVASGQALCEMASHGAPGLELIGDLRDNNPEMDINTATQFAALSAHYFCPQQLVPKAKKSGS
ncbi:hypothetical protein A5672_26540 [Mycobacterium alsense]|uniref:DUF732 domain-containing protein n=1 Tax=Mycobacterium alsense TaxID=324058 RepID=A0ABD6NWB0_9MYCO|nr:DUF732 domain-containing protein [Mycobacterium alsense]OBG31744.1 hypothetical protein A5672_26540 [Mycobacterium alsense]